MSRDPRIRVRLPLLKIPDLPPLDLRPDSTYNILIEYPETRTSLVIKRDRPVRPGFEFIETLSPRLMVKTRADADLSPTSSLTVVAE